MSTAMRTTLITTTMRRMVYILALAPFVFGITAFGQATTLRVGLVETPQSFNPLIATDGHSSMAMDLMYPKLFRYDSELRFSPYVAESWEISDDGLSYTFHLNKNAVWSDGVPITTRDIQMSIQLWGNSSLGSIVAGNFTSIIGMKAYASGASENVEGIKIVDDHTVVIELESPAAGFMHNLYYHLLPAHVLESVPLSELLEAEYFMNPSVTAGPYRFIRYERDRLIVLEAYKDFVLGQPKIDRVLLSYGAQQSQIAQFLQGQLDIVTLRPSDLASVEGIASVNLYTVPFVINYVHVNLERDYLTDKKVRQAMMYAIDREAIASALVGDYGKAVAGPYISPGWVLNDDLEPYSYNPERARELLVEANWDSAQTLQLRIATGNETRTRTAALMQQYLGQVGVQVDIEVSDSPTLLSDVREGNYDLGILGWGFGVDPNAASMVFESTNTPPAGWNVMHYANGRVDELLRIGREHPAIDDRLPAYLEFQEIVNDELPSLFLFTEPNIIAARDTVKGIVPTASYRWGYIQWALWDIHNLDLSE